MTLRLTVLASGSAGNASLVQADRFGVLIDAGLGPRILGDRLREAGYSWSDVHAQLLSHTHSDHWNDRTLAWLARRKHLLYCHPSHHAILSRHSTGFASLLTAGLVREYQAWQPFTLGPGLTCLPVPVQHDAGATFAFRLDGPRDLFGQGVSLGYASDLGCWDESLVEALAEVDVLAIEFNHDVFMQQASGRPRLLIERVLGNQGHLSNAQAADLLRAVTRRGPPGRLCHVVQLHLSRDCNRPELARRAAQEVIQHLPQRVQIHTAEQARPGRPIEIRPSSRKRKEKRSACDSSAKLAPARQNLLWESSEAD